MKPTLARLGVILFAASLTAATLGADDTRPAPKPVKRGGYGSDTSAPPPPSIAAPARGSDTTAAWMVAAEAHLAATVDEVNQRAVAADRAWAGIGDRIDARVRELMQQAGFSASEMGACYSTPKEPPRYEDLYRGYYAKEADILVHANLRRVANPPVFSNQQEAIYKDGNRAAVEAAVAALDEELGLFRYYDGLLQKQLAVHFESEAQRRYLGADAYRTQLQITEAGKSYDAGDYGDATNTAVRAKVRPLEEKEDRERHRVDDAWDPRLALWYSDLLHNLRVFGGFERMVTQQDNPIVKRTDRLVPLAEVTRRMEEHTLDLANRSGQLYDYPVFQRWEVSDGSYYRFYQRQVQAIGSALFRWFKRGGATTEELDRIDAQMKAMADVELGFHAMIQQLANYQQQQTALTYRIGDLEGEIHDIEERARKLRGAGDYAAASAVESQADPLREHAGQLFETLKQVHDQNQQYINKTNTDVGAMKFIEPLPGGRVVGIQIEVPTEDQPYKIAVPTQPLKGAPVILSLTRHVTDVTLGLPLVVRVDWEQEEGEAPAEQTLNLVLGGKSVPLTLRLNSNRNGYYSPRVIFQQPPAAPPAEAPLIQP